MVSRVLVGALVVAVLAAAVPASAQVVSPVHFLPVVVKAKGVAGTLWRSDVSITNLTNKAVTVTAAYLPEKQTNFPPLQHTHEFTLQSRQTILVEDVVGKWFPGFGDNTKGAMLVYTENPSFSKGMFLSKDALMAQGKGEAAPSLAVTSRAYNAANPDATYGQTVASNPYGYFFGIAAGEMTGMRQDTRFRTNIGVVNLSGLTAAVLVTVYDETGRLLAHKTEHVEGFSLRQWNLKREFGVDGLHDGLVEVKIDPSVANQDPCGNTAGGLSPMLVAYYSKNDFATGDAEFGVAQVDWRQYAVECHESPMEQCPAVGE
ncbi:MAG: hypothetical protein GXP48_10365 [Acidobacteria bacterium]|nr:hypothetical protein [Acidobacteriota bacterium]